MKSEARTRRHYAAVMVFLLLLVQATNVASRERDDGIIAEAPAEEYAGSRACKACHREKYEDWSGRLMSRFVRYRRDITGSLPGNWANSPISKDDVFLVVGVNRKLAFVDKNWQVFPYQYHLGKQKWMARDKWADRDYRARCAACHTVGLNPDTKRFVELNVGCEACHGPGKDHTRHPVQTKMKVPGKTDGHDVLFTCRRCHNERGKHARGIASFHGVFHIHEQ